MSDSRKRRSASLLSYTLPMRAGFDVAHYHTAFRYGSIPFHIILTEAAQR
jgi:hypothetical protein